MAPSVGVAAAGCTDRSCGFADVSPVYVWPGLSFTAVVTIVANGAVEESPPCGVSPVVTM